MYTQGHSTKGPHVPEAGRGNTDRALAAGLPGSCDAFSGGIRRAAGQAFLANTTVSNFLFVSWRLARDRFSESYDTRETRVVRVLSKGGRGGGGG